MQVVYFFNVIFYSYLSSWHVEFVSPAQVRSIRRKGKGDGYKERILARQERASRQIERKREEDPLAVAKVFA